MTPEDTKKLLQALDTMSQLVEKGLFKFHSAAGLPLGAVVEMRKSIQELNEKHN
jgi:hypothetical protein